MWDLFGNPEDRFSHDEAQFVLHNDKVLSVLNHQTEFVETVSKRVEIISEFYGLFTNVKDRLGKNEMGINMVFIRNHIQL